MNILAELFLNTWVDLNFNINAYLLMKHVFDMNQFILVESKTKINLN